MRGRTTKTSSVAAAVLIVVNVLVMTCCLLLFSTGIWVIASPGTFSSAVQTHGHAILKALLQRDALDLKAGVGAALLSMVLFIISFMGFYGALTRSPFPLFMYAAIVMLLLALECALFYYFTSEIQQKGIHQHDGQWTHALRLSFRCCEHNATTLPARRLAPPWSCCGHQHHPDNCTIQQAYSQDCQKTITKWTEKYETVVYTSLTVLHIILASCSLVRRARNVVSLSVR